MHYSVLTPVLIRVRKYCEENHMNWIDSTRFAHYDSLAHLRDVLLGEYAEVGADRDCIGEAVSVEERYGVDSQPNIRWHAYPLLNSRVVDDSYSVYWPLSTRAVLAVPGVINAAINYIAPGCIIPDHTDDYYDMSTEVVGDLRGVGTMIGIDMPSSDPDVVGFHVGEDRLGWSTGDIVSFDGYVRHGGWNHSLSWRVTLIIDTEISLWNLG
jgi:hypothetical protein